MDDLIHRQDAIDAAIDAADDWDGGCSKERERFIREALEELPSVHPDVPDTNVGDLISRQAAIDALDEIEAERREIFLLSYLVFLRLTVRTAGNHTVS